MDRPPHHGTGSTRSGTIILMGLRGCGKSTVGGLIAARAGSVHIDLDDRTAGELECDTPAEAIGRHGLDAFRAAETRALRAALAGGGVVLSLGGGTPTAPGSVEILDSAKRGGAELIYLHAGPDVLRGRLEPTDHASRPSLTGRGMLDEIGEIYLRRDPLYRGLCSRLIETEGIDAPTVARMILDFI
jgi:shikimate kinase